MFFKYSCCQSLKLSSINCLIYCHRISHVNVSAIYMYVPRDEKMFDLEWNNPLSISLQVFLFGIEFVQYFLYVPYIMLTIMFSILQRLLLALPLFIFLLLKVCCGLTSMLQHKTVGFAKVVLLLEKLGMALAVCRNHFTLVLCMYF